MIRFITCLFILATAAGCHHASKNETFAFIQIQDRNGLTETISNPDRLPAYQAIDFLTSQPYKKVLRVYKGEEKSRSIITTYHPNGTLCQYLEAEEMRAHGAYREWFPNGQLKIEAIVLAGTADLSPGVQEDWIFDSLSKVWDEQGHLIATIPYNKGMLEGKSTYYYPSGQIEKELFFVKNRLDGQGIEYWPNGALKCVANYKNGNKEGRSEGFFADGKIASVEDYLDGRLRTGSYYSPYGDHVAQIENGGGFQASFDEGSMTLIEHRIGLPDGLVQKFTRSSEIQRSYHLKSGKKHGEEVEYFLPADLAIPHDRPLPKLSVNWHENMVHGTVKTWYNNGQLQSQREYSRNLRTGPSLAWYRDGSLMIYEEYEEDRLVTGQYCKMQKKEPVSSVIHGNGLATLYDETGALLRKVPYLKGKPVDPED
jgi:antitoxin component YwqK of YwqJK toxin-antitoxin module